MNSVLLTTKLHGRASQLAGRTKGSGRGFACAGRNHDGRLAVPLAIRLGILDQAGLFLGAAQAPGRTRDPKRAVVRGHDERPRSATGQGHGRQTNGNTQIHGTFSLMAVVATVRMTDPDGKPGSGQGSPTV